MCLRVQFTKAGVLNRGRDKHLVWIKYLGHIDKFIHSLEWCVDVASRETDRFVANNNVSGLAQNTSSQDTINITMTGAMVPNVPILKINMSYDFPHAIVPGTPQGVQLLFGSAHRI